MNHAMPRATRAPFALALLAGSALAAPAFGQDAQTAPSGTVSAQAQPVIVESTRIPTELDKIGASVTVITEEDIKEAQDRQVTDTLKRVPGLNVTQNGAFGAQASVFLRGSASQQTLVLIDGVEVNDPSKTQGAFDFGGLDPSNIEKIEVLRGPQSTLYGSDAIGGVISITTKSGKEGFSADAFLEGGSYETVRGSGTVRGGTERARGSLTVSGTDSEGISIADENAGNDEQDGFSDVTVATKGSVDLAENFSLSGTVNVSQQSQELDFGSGDTGDDSDTTRLNGRLRASHTALNGRLKNRVSLKTLRMHRQNFDASGDLDLDADSERNVFAYQGTMDAADWLVVTFGAETEGTEAQTDDWSGDFRTTSGYASAQITPLDRLTITGGARYDANSDTENAATGRVSASYRLRETGTTIRGLWGQGFRTPSANELVGIYSFSFNGTTTNNQVGNPNLVPEESESWEVGVDQTLFNNRIKGSVTYFNQNIENNIFYSGSIFRGQYQNIDETEHQGVETSLTARMTDWATLSANYTYLDAVNVTDNEQLVRRPRHTGSATLQLAPTDKLDLGTTVRYRGQSEDGRVPNRVTLGDAVIVDVRGSYKVTECASIYGRIENLLNDQYQVADGYGTPDISGFAGVRVSF